MAILWFFLLITHLLVPVLAKLNIEYPHEWHSWKAQHGINYEDEHVELGRHIVWLSNNKYIDEHNKYAEEFGYTLEMNSFGDLVSALKLFVRNATGHLRALNKLQL